jgi:hypothetical protein
MVRPLQVHLLLKAWDEIDRALADVAPNDLTRQIEGGSSFAWTLTHVTHGVDSWINGRFLGLPPHAIYSGGRFLFGGNGRAEDFEEIRIAVDEIRASARPFLLDTSTDFDRNEPYDGSFIPFREHGIRLSQAVLQNAVHHIFHLGEIVAKRGLMGYATDSFPGSFLEQRSGT